MLNRFRSAAKAFWNPSAKAVKPLQSRYAVKSIRAKYDAAQDTDRMARYLTNLDSLSADAANSASVRLRLRNFARYETANNSYARGITLTLANDCIGTGPRLQLLIDDETMSELVERAWQDWCNASGFAEKLRTMRASKAVDGESFAMTFSNKSMTNPVKLDLRLIEAEQVSTPYFTGEQSNAVDGIVFDENGVPVQYHLLKNHPGGNAWNLNLDYSKVNAEDMFHWFRVDRPGQHRGIPEIMSALPLFAQLRQYTLAEIAAAEQASTLAGVIQQPTPPADGDDDVSPEALDTFEPERGALQVMPEGWSLNQWKAEHPTGTYAEFKKEIINEIARCLNMPFNVAAGNSAGYNYSSGRLDHQTYFKAIALEQHSCEINVLDRFFEKWWYEACLSLEGFPVAMRYAPPRHDWLWDGYEHVDPAKEANAQATRLQNNTTTLADELGMQKKDWREVLKQRAKEISYAKELGIVPVQPPPVKEEEVEEPEEEPVEKE